MGAHARCQKRLVTVAHGGVGDEDALFVAHPVGKAFRPQTVQQLLRTVRRRRFDVGHDRLDGLVGRRGATLGFRVTVDGNVGQIGQKLGGAVLTLHLGKKLRRRVDETRRVGIVAEALVADDCFQEGEIGRHAADTEFAQRAVHTADRLIRFWRPCGDLDEQRIVIAGDDGAAIGRAAIQTNAEARGRTIGGDATVIGNEIVLGIFRGDAALKRVTVEADILLLRHTGFGRADGGTL